ncbi:MAG TPA: MBL fold metallo-hydrolase [Planctomycetota bacterium]|nr:MBL fold metallo-hydrolase [Planctomycetota bacterium]
MSRRPLAGWIPGLLAPLLCGAIGSSHLAVAPAAPPPAAPPPALTPLQVHFIDVGTGDCIWIRTGDDGVPGNGRLEGYDIVIDGGDGGAFGRIDGYSFASEYLVQEDRLPSSSAIEWLILTHPHSDHCGGLPGFLEDYEVRNILDPGLDKQEPGKPPDRLRPGTAYGKFFAAASAELDPDGQPARFLWGLPPGLHLDWGAELTVSVFWSSRAIVGGDLNNVSIVLRLAFTDPGQDASFLFTGDAEEFIEGHLVVTRGDALRSTVLKAGHHGSNSSTSEDFLRRVRPRHVVVSSGNQAFGGTLLPRPETFERIARVSDELGLATAVWRTDRGDKEPLVKTVGSEGGDDTIVVTTFGRASDLTVRYASDPAPSGVVADPTRCQATTLAGAQCRRAPSAGSPFCWQHQP